jgi:hypothetical protein
MKKLFAMLMCTILGFSAYAINSVPKTAQPVHKIEVKNEMNEFKISFKPLKNTSFRRSECFVFHDECGQTVTYYVSGPNNATDYQLWLAAYKDYEQHVYADGCY